MAQTNTDMGETAGVEDTKQIAQRVHLSNRESKLSLPATTCLIIGPQGLRLNHCLPTRNPTPPEEGGGEVAWAYCSAPTDAQQINALSTI